MAVIDVTDHVVNYLKEHFVGKGVTADGIKIGDSVNRYGVGNKTYASGSATISSFVSHNGKIEKAPIFDGYGYRSEMNLNYRFDGQTSSEKYQYPGRILIDHPWGNLHPSGEIEFHIHAGQDTNWTVTITRMTFENIAEDRPNKFIQEHVASQFRGIMETLLPEAVASSPNPEVQPVG
ncbi:hypothetical protein [Gorillibacterium sp. CAU 1737]|uniref:hypothetical protein n=1 Tax=Gorillibacterium sp. CAU 1737 TaxID=3140362 RepID=UPI003260AEA4